ncbi:MAG: hypothetical protein GXN94_03115 [Aquificae bacterium]|nr:hypothetical protein [Aquificota bacterium]
MLLIFLLFIGGAYGSTIKTCYRIEYLFFDVAKVCVQYTFEENEIKSFVDAKTVGVVGALKGIHYKGYAVATKDFKSKEFYFYRKEKNNVEIHHYIFTDKWVNFSKISVEKNKQKHTGKKIKNEGFIDPFTAGLYYVKMIKENKPIERRIFFNGKAYYVPYQNRKLDGKYLYAEINPSNIKVGGLLQPVGVWKIWVSLFVDKVVKGIINIKAGIVKLEKID